MERYRILYLWKILEGYAPNCGIEVAHENKRLGRKTKIPSLVRNGRQSVKNSERTRIPNKWGKAL